MVLDNASCQEVQHLLLELRRQGVINYLILASQNMRKLGAVKFLLGRHQAEIITLTDSDVYFAPGWFEATAAVLEAFPEAGQVTALPTGDKTDSFCSATVDAVKTDASLEVKEGHRLILSATSMLTPQVWACHGTSTRHGWGMRSNSR